MENRGEGGQVNNEGGGDNGGGSDEGGSDGRGK